MTLRIRGNGMKQQQLGQQKGQNRGTRGTRNRSEIRRTRKSYSGL